MLLAALVLGGLALYFFGVRAALWSAGAIALWQVGSRRPRPPDAVLAVRLVRGAVKRAWSTARSLLGSNGDKND